MKNQLPRQLEKEAFPLIERFPVVGIVGPRQVGKTTLVKQLAAQLKKPTRYLDLEYPEDFAALSEPVRFLERIENETVIIDEVQRMPSLFPVLRAMIDRRREPGRFILLGSASPELIQKSSETLAGRIAFLELRPLALAELPPEIDWQMAWLRGGFPESILAENDRDSLDWRQNFIRAYLERDLPLLGLKAEPMILRRFWTMLGHLNSQLLNKDALSSSLGLNVATVNRYLDFFESAFLIKRLQPFSANLGKRLVKTPKIFLRDSGVFHSLLNISNYQNLLANPALGASWEAFVLQELLFHLPADRELFFYRTQDGTEADFVVTNAGIPEILMEVKFSSAPTVSKGFYIAKSDLRTSKNVVVAPVGHAFHAKNGVEIIGLSDLKNLFFS